MSEEKNTEELHRLRLEVETLRDLRAKSDAAAYEVIRAINAEHERVQEELLGRLKATQQDLATQKKLNHAATVEVYQKRVSDLETTVAKSIRARMALQKDMASLVAVHFGGSFE